MRFLSDFNKVNIQRISNDPYYQETIRLLRDRLKNPWLSGMSMMGLGAIATQQGEPAQALMHFEEGERLFHQLGDRHMVIAMESEQAHIERQLGHYPEALALYSKTLSGWQELGHLPALAHELECFAFIANARSQQQQAAHLFGAAEALRERSNAPMTANERPEYDQNVSALRAQMDASAFAAAWAEGRAMPVEQAIELALIEGR